MSDPSHPIHVEPQRAHHIFHGQRERRRRGCGGGRGIMA